MVDLANRIAAIDLFCGAGGLSYGLRRAGIRVVAGIDLDPACRFPFKTNLRSKFLLRDVAEVTGEDLENLWPATGYRLLAGCAPCQPFSSHRRGANTSGETNWGLLAHFSRLVRETTPDFVTMENVPRLRSLPVFREFVKNLRRLGYAVDYGILYGPEFDLPQERRRLVLLASRVGVAHMPKGTRTPGEFRTVRDAIYDLPAVQHGQSDPTDAMHSARHLTPINLARMQASTPGGTWRSWPEDLVAPCHRKVSGSSFHAFYGRMEWDAPSPTITTQSFNFGTGRFGHPEQDRSLTLREAAMLQGFPRRYKFVPEGEAPTRLHVGRLIGNAVPPQFGLAVGRVFVKKAKAASELA